ncbi:MAG: hypothetical protein ACYDGX_01160 [Thermoleophilia bacterium]
MIKESDEKKEVEPKALANIQALRREALSVLYAKHAAEDQSVKDFREVVLKNKLLKWDEVKGWIEKQSKTEKSQGLSHVRLTLPLPPGTEIIEDNKGFTSFDPPLKIKQIDPNDGDYETGCRFLDYAGPKDRLVQSELVFCGGILEKLMNLSETLAGRYSWMEAQATVFVLAGVRPRVSSNRINYKTKFAVTSANRIKLTLDPALTDKEVASIYRYARRHLLKQDKQGKARFRLQSEKHLHLAIFNAEHEGMTYRLKMKGWNNSALVKKNPRWKYQHESNFSRDCKVAEQRLLQPDYFDMEGRFDV